MLALFIEIGIRVFFFVLLLSAATHKLRSRDEIAGTIAAYFRSFIVLSPGAASVLGRIVILGEIVVALLALLGPLQISAVSIAALMLVYAVAMGANLLIGNRNLDCGCSRQATVPVTWSLVMRNSVLALLAALLLVDSAGEALTPLIFLNGLALSFGGLCFYAFVEQLLQNQSLLEGAAP